MGLFSKLFKSDDRHISVGAPVKGRTVPLSEVSDPTFSAEILGKGIAVIPEDDVIKSPCDGVIDLMFDTGHAVNLRCDNGAEVLIHVGLDTVSLKGEGFRTLKQTDEKVKKGDPLIEFDRVLLKEKGFDTVIPIIICNTDQFKKVSGIEGKDVVPGDDVIVIEKE